MCIQTHTHTPGTHRLHSPLQTTTTVTRKCPAPPSPILRAALRLLKMCVNARLLLHFEVCLHGAAAAPGASVLQRERDRGEGRSGEKDFKKRRVEEEKD